MQQETCVFCVENSEARETKGRSKGEYVRTGNFPSPCVIWGRRKKSAKREMFENKDFSEQGGKKNKKIPYIRQNRWGGFIRFKNLLRA